MSDPPSPRSADPVLGKHWMPASRCDAAGAALCAPEVLVDRRADGTIYLKSARALPAYPDKLTDRLVHWAQRRARSRVHGGTRRRGGGWRTITYAQTLEKVRRIGAALLTRNLSAERPIVILSGNDLEHALLGLAANYVGIPYAPVSPAYSLISSDFGKLRHIVNLLTPGPRVRLRRRAIRARDRGGRAARRRSDRIRLALDRARRRARTPPTRRTRTSRPTPSRNSCSPPARPACRRA